MRESIGRSVYCVLQNPPAPLGKGGEGIPAGLRQRDSRASPPEVPVIYLFFPPTGIQGNMCVCIRGKPSLCLCVCEGLGLWGLGLGVRIIQTRGFQALGQRAKGFGALALWAKCTRDPRS